MSQTVPGRLIAAAVTLAAAGALLVPSLASAATSPPTGLKVAATGATQVALTWTPPVATTVTSYRIYRNSVAIGTSDKDTPNYLDTKATVNTTSVYTVAAVSAAGTSAPSAGAVAKTATGPLKLYSCYGGELNTGHLALGADVTAPAGKPCFTFTSGSNLSLDCLGHKITEARYYEPLDISNVTGFLVTNCVFAGTTPGVLGSLSTNSTGGRFDHNTFTAPSGSEGLAGWESSPGVVIANNTFVNTALTIGRSAGAYIGHNTATESATFDTGGVITASESDNVSIVANTMDGGAPAGASHGGVDDGIVLYGPISGALVSANKIAHVYDAGIEPVDVLKNSKIIGNTVSYATVDGIGEYWNTDFENNLVSGNKVDHSQRLFLFLAAYDTRLHPPSSAFSGVKMINNRFDGNTFTSPLSTSIPSSEFSLVNSAVSVSVSGNLFGNNSFGYSSPTPTVTPSSGFASYAGNLCPASSVIACH